MHHESQSPVTSPSPLDLFIQQAIAAKKGKNGAKVKPSPFAKFEAEKAKKDEEKALKRLEAIRILSEIRAWKYTAVVMLINRTTCKACGCVHEHCAESIFVKMTNQTLGTHERNISKDYSPDMYPGIPREIEYWDREIAMCRDCFETEIHSCSQPQTQLDLIPRVMKSFSQHEPFAEQKNQLISIHNRIQELEKTS